MKVVFLDFDGVINTHEGAWDSAAIARLNRITDATGAVIVVSSSWREAFPDPEDASRCEAPMATRTTDGAPATLRCQACRGCQEETLAILRDFLAGSGVTAKVIGLTPVLDGEPRGREIQAWLDENRKSVEGYVILDDTDDCQTDSLSKASDEELVEIKRLAYASLGYRLQDEFEAFGRDHLVLTSWVGGLREEHVRKAVAVLMLPIPMIALDAPPRRA